MRKARFQTDLAFIDMLFTWVMIFAAMFIFAVMSIAVQTPPKSGVDLKAEFLITLEWPSQSADDLDLWVMLPSLSRVSFRNKSVEHANLERDDLGLGNDLIPDGNGGVYWYRHTLKTDPEKIEHILAEVASKKEEVLNDLETRVREKVKEIIHRSL